VQSITPSSCTCREGTVTRGQTALDARWDEIQNMRSADQADSDCTDKWRTGSAIHAAENGGFCRSPAILMGRNGLSDAMKERASAPS